MNYTCVVSIGAREEEDHSYGPWSVPQTDEDLFEGLVLLFTFSPAERGDSVFLELHFSVPFHLCCLDFSRACEIKVYSYKC